MVNGVKGFFQINENYTINKSDQLFVAICGFDQRSKRSVW